LTHEMTQHRERTILLLGHDGQIGWELNRRLSALGAVRAVSYPDVDFCDQASLRTLVREAQPDLIVNAAAYTAVDAAEDEPAVARAVNAEGPAVLAEEASHLQCPIVHYSTDFVFDGAQENPYTEVDSPAPLNVYGQTKLDGDRAVLATATRNLVFRVSWIYGMRGRNFFLAVRDRAARGLPLRVVNDQIGAPTWCAAVAEGTVAVLSQVCAGDPSAQPWGLYNMVCGGCVSWYGFAKAFLPQDVSIEPVPSSEYPTRARRPPRSVLDCRKLKKTFGIELPHWHDALKQCLQA